VSYEDRPWLKQYDAGMPTDIDPEFATGLDMFRAAVARRPDDVLLQYFDHGLTTAEVDRATDALAAALVADGFRPGDRLAVYLQNVPQFVLAMVATWKAGGIMVSINPMNKARELEFLLSDSGATVLVCLESLYAETAKDVIAGGTTAVRSVITTSELDFLDGAVPPFLSTPHGSGRLTPTTSWSSSPPTTGSVPTTGPSPPTTSPSSRTHRARRGRPRAP